MSKIDKDPSSMSIRVMTTYTGKVLSFRSSHGLVDAAAPLQELLARPLSAPFGCIYHDIQRVPFIFTYRRFFKFFYIWHGQECHESMLRYGMEKSLARYPWPACLTCCEGKILYVNRAFTEYLATASQEFHGKFFSDLIEPKSEIENQTKAKIYALRTHEGQSVTLTLSHAVQSQDSVALFLFPALLDTINQSTGDVGLLYQLPLPAAILDENGGIWYCNPALKLHLCEGESMALAQWVEEKDRYSFSQQLRRLRKSPEDCARITVRLRNGPDRAFLIFLKYIPGHHEKQTPGQFLALFAMQDIFVPMKEADPQKMQLLGQLASGIVHDFNNMLTGILGFCDLLLQRHMADEPSFNDVQQIKHSALGAARLIQQLLSFSKTTPPSLSPIFLVGCIKDLFPLMHRMVGPRIVLTLEKISARQEKLWVHGDKNQLEQILLNLAINARDAMPEGGMLSFHVYHKSFKQPYPVMKGMLPAQDYVVVDIRDTGTGIDPQYVDRIFEPFFSTKTEDKGTGLGLANVLQIVHHFRGGVTVDSHMGTGTTFSLYFPCHALNSDETQAFNSPEPADVNPGALNPNHNLNRSPAAIKKQTFSGVRILLVEDEDPVRLFAARALRAKGHEVVEARDGVQALQHLDTQNVFHVVVTDVMMPGIDGPTLALRIQNKWPLIKILFVSGYPEEQVRSHLPQAMQKVYFLPKPFSLEDLVGKIKDLCRENSFKEEGF